MIAKGLALLVLVSLLAAADQPAPAADVVRTSSSTFLVTGDGGELLTFYPLSYGPKYAWMGTPNPKTTKTDAGTQFLYPSSARSPLEWTLGMTPDGTKLQIDASVSAPKDIDITYVAVVFQPGSALAGGKVVLAKSDATSEEIALPIRPHSITDGYTGATFFDKAGKQLAAVAWKTPARVHADGNIRVLLAEKTLPAAQPGSNQFTLDLGQVIRFYASTAEVPMQDDHSKWFAFTPRNDNAAGAIGMADWLAVPEKPLQIDGDHFLRDGRPLKIWGTNVEYAENAPRKEVAEKRAAFFAKFGVNGVRLHKLTNPGWEGLGSKTSAAEYDPAALERFDYFTAQLRKNGVVYGFSPIWDLKVFPGDRDALVAYDEVAKAGDTRGLVWFAEDVQDLHIKTMLNLLDHRNPNTHLRYADDPALSYIEIQNEEDVFFYTVTPRVRACPTYQKMLARQFSAWLKDRYGSNDGLVKAWGRPAINRFAKEGGLPDEDLDKENIVPVGNPWMWDNIGKTGDYAVRLQDTARFLFACQSNYYARMVEAIRKAGYTGPIVASNWQAGSTTGHFLNLASDARVGIIDRHNYMGGAQGNPGHVMHNGFGLSNATVLDNPGSGLLSSGLQQVAGHPFSVSEWLAVVPHEWAAADTAIMAIYGMGLQDWDASYHFASNGDGFTPTLEYPGDKKFNNLTPVGFGLYPVLSRMTLRGDVRPGDPVATRRLTIDQAIDQTYDFQSTTEQQGDTKSFGGVASDALGIGRVLVEFVDKPMASTFEDLAKYRDGRTIVSTTGQLRWTLPGGKESGYFSVNTPGTQGAVGFGGGKTFALGDMTLAPATPYSVILATARSPAGTLATDKQVILLAVARAHNTDMNLGKDMIYSVGKAPILLEPVQAKVQFKRTAGKVTVLDADGLPTEKTYPLSDGTFVLDTGRDKTIYYLVEFDEK